MKTLADIGSVFQNFTKTYFEYKEVPNPNGGVSLVTPAGLHKSLTPDGFWQNDSPNEGPWESFIIEGNMYVAYRVDSNGQSVVHVFPRFVFA